jgi:AP-1-like transcription factor
MKYTPTDFVTAIRNNLSNDSETASITLDTPMADNHNSNSYNESNNITPRPSAGPPNPHVISPPVPRRLTFSKGSFAPSSHRVTISPLTGQRLLSAGATWDYIQAHQLFQDGLVDIADVSERLKGLAQCDGTGPSFEEGRVRRAIEESAEQLKGKDELI